MSWRIVACSCLLIALPVRAEPDPQPALPAEAQVASISEIRQDPEELLREALVAYAADDLAKARALFEEVHRLRPSARTLRALGVLAYRESRFAEAVTLLEESLSSRVKPLTEELARGASELLGQARVLAQAASIPAPRQDLAAPTVPAVDPPPQPPVVRSAPVSVSPTSANGRLDLRRLRRTSYALYAVAGAAVVVAAVGTALGMTRLDDIEARCRESAAASCTPERARQLEGREKLRLLSGLSIGGTVLAALSGGSAVTLSLWLRGRSDAPAAGPIGGLAIQLTAHF
jgi:tetratricopeptide (TPR) repeat protein